MNKPLVLASKSPRRKELLTQLGYRFTCDSADIDETPLNNETAKDMVERLAIAKAKCVNAQYDSKEIVLGSDTCVVINDNILGKPTDYQDCFTQLSKLSGKSHQVYTAIAVVSQQKVMSTVVTTTVTFKTLSENEIRNYWSSGEPQDKAGSYGIQGIGGQFVTHINGSYSAVVGLPLFETADVLAKFGVVNPIQDKY